MRPPKYSAEASLGPSSISYGGAVGFGTWVRGAIIPSGGCDGVNCDAAQFFCFASLDLDPISCGLYYGCCQGQVSQAPTADDCRNNPCGPGCPSDLCIQSMGSALSSLDPTLSEGFSGLSSQLASIGRQLRGIAKCVCPPPTISSVVGRVPPWVSTVSQPPPVPPVPYARR